MCAGSPDTEDGQGRQATRPVCKRDRGRLPGRPPTARQGKPRYAGRGGGGGGGGGQWIQNIPLRDTSPCCILTEIMAGQWPFSGVCRRPFRGDLLARWEKWRSVRPFQAGPTGTSSEMTYLLSGRHGRGGWERKGDWCRAWDDAVMEYNELAGSAKRPGACDCGRVSYPPREKTTLPRWGWGI